MEQIILIVHVLIAISIIGLILLQQGKGADMGASFGSGGSQTVFGSQGSGNLLTRATAVLATTFFITSFGMAIFAKDKAQSVGDVDIPIPAIEQQVTSPEPDSDFPEMDLPEAGLDAGEESEPLVLDVDPQSVESELPDQ